MLTSITNCVELAYGVHRLRVGEIAEAEYWTPQDVSLMPIYATLFSHTDAGTQDIDVISTEVFPRARELTQQLGGELRSLYDGSVGGYDGVAIVKFHDVKSMERGGSPSIGRAHATSNTTRSSKPRSTSK